LGAFPKNTKLLNILVKQIRKGQEKGLELENMKDMTAAMKEIRAMVNDSKDALNLNLEAAVEVLQKIEFVMYDPSKKDLEGEPLEDQSGQ